MTDEVEVWLEADFLEHMRVGTIAGRSALRMTRRGSRTLRPLRSTPTSLSARGATSRTRKLENFRVFDDSAPDRWGQTLMKRREALAAKDAGRKPRTLHAWDFLLGVEDISRQGALRYRRPGEEAFLAHETLTVPPAASLRELEIVAREITAKRIDDLEALRQWLKVLMARGRAIVAEILRETRGWRQAAQTLKIARADVELTATAFAESDGAHD